MPKQLHASRACGQRFSINSFGHGKGKTIVITYDEPIKNSSLKQGTYGVEGKTVL